MHLKQRQQTAKGSECVWLQQNLKCHLIIKFRFYGCGPGKAPGTLRRCCLQSKSEENEGGKDKTLVVENVSHKKNSNRWLNGHAWVYETRKLVRSDARRKLWEFRARWILNYFINFQSLNNAAITLMSHNFGVGKNLKTSKNLGRGKIVTGNLLPTQKIHWTVWGDKWLRHVISQLKTN